MYKTLCIFNVSCACLHVHQPSDTLQHVHVLFFFLLLTSLIQFPVVCSVCMFCICCVCVCACDNVYDVCGGGGGGGDGGGAVARLELHAT